MTNLAYDIISYEADDMRCWPEQFSGYSLSHLEDICYNYLDDVETEEERVRLANNVAVEIFGMLQVDPEDVED